MFALSLAQLRAHTSRLVATCLAIMIAVAFVVATLVLNATSDATVKGAVAAQYKNTDAVITTDQNASSTSLSDDPKLAAKIARVPGVRAVAVDQDTYLQVRLPGTAGYRYAKVTSTASAPVLQ